TTARWLSLLSSRFHDFERRRNDVKVTMDWVVTILVLFAMAPSSFAQVQIQIFPDVSSSEVQTNRNAQTARPGTNGAGLLISGSLLGASPLTATTLRIGYPGPITSQPAIDPGDGFNCTDGTTGGTVVCPSS